MAIAAPVSSSFCVPYQTQLIVKQSNGVFSRMQYTIKDEQGTSLFKMGTEDWGGLLTPSTKRIIYEADSEKVLLSMTKHRKLLEKSQWVAFHGHNQDESQLLFTTRRNHSLYEVFLPGSDSRPDFSIEKESWRSSNFSVLSNGSPIAQVEKTGWGDEYTINIYPEVDRAFIVALSIIWIIDTVEASIVAIAAVFWLILSPGGLLVLLSVCGCFGDSH